MTATQVEQAFFDCGFNWLEYLHTIFHNETLEQCLKTIFKSWPKLDSWDSTYWVAEHLLDSFEAR